MTDKPVRTRVRTDDGWLDFQDYFVRLRQAPEVREVRFEGAGNSSVTPEVKEALAAAEAVVVAPSNPIVSIGPILAVPGIGEAIAAARARGVRSVGVSGIVGGKALRGPADRMMASLGDEPTALGVARRYASMCLLDVFVLDRLDESLARDVMALGLEVVVTETVMTDVGARVQLARDVLAATLPPA
jgi:LPPG:FO 2-phospho-L-lactate transferase